MTKARLMFGLVLTILLSSSVVWVAAQGDEGVIRVDVDMVQMNVAVTDNKGNYVTGLDPKSFEILEDGVVQQIATFEEGNQGPRNLLPRAREDGAANATQLLPSDAQPPAVGSGVFILFDTSDYMYRDFASAQDSMVDFVRTLDRTDRVAFYSYSRDLSRDVPLTADRLQVLRGMHTVTAGNDAALYGAMLLTLKDASQFSGRKVMVVFTHGPDNASMVSPEAVGELAQSEGVPIYMVSTRKAELDVVSKKVFERLSASTGGEAYFARSWQEEQKVFTAIRDDLSHLYTLSYYPRPNPNRGWRTLRVRMVGPNVRNLNLRTRNGYRPRPPRTFTDLVSLSAPLAPTP